MMANGCVDQFNDAFQVGFQRKGPMTDGQVSSFGKMLHASKGKCRSLMELGSMVHIASNWVISSGDSSTGLGKV
jgi:hypothetical protein